MAKEVLEMEVKSNIGEVADGLDRAAVSTKKLEGATKKAGNGFQRLKGVVKGVGMALKAAGIGIIVALVAKLMEVFSSNQKVLDAFNTGMTGLTMAFNDLFNFLSNNIGSFTGFFKDIFENPQQALKDFGDMIQNNLIERFESLLDTFGYVASGLGALLKGNFKEAGEFAKQAGKEIVDVATGVDDSFDKTVNTVNDASKAIVNYTKKTLKAAAAVTATQKAAELAAVEFAKLNAQYLKDAEIQRQIRDDETKTFAERIAANEELDEILKKQQELQKESIQTQIAAAAAQYNINGNQANFIELEKQKVAMLELEEAITGQLSEQKTNQVGLEKELLEAQNEIRAAGLEGMSLELEELKTSYEAQVDLARKAGMDITDIKAQYEADQTAITETEANKQKSLAKSKLDFELGMANQGLQAIASAAGEGTAIAKAAAIAQATMAGTQSVINAFNAANVNVAATAGSFGAYPVTMAALAGTFAAMNIAKIASGGKPGPADAPPPPDTAPPAPQMMSGAFDISGGIAPEALKTYVVTDEMSNSQNQLANIRRRATI
tara:strand:- start:295 stop:1947 length:1653 start_codon:yes stop_codon:yes gene_type:complete